MINNDIKDWAINLPYWQQYISEKIYNGDVLDKNDLEYIYNLFKQEFLLVEEPLIKEEITFSSFVRDNSTEPLKWRGVRNVRGVNALKSNDELKIGNNLTLIYGKNGSGKSGYTRLLNNIFISRGDKDIIQNIYSDDAEEIDANILFEKSNKKIEEYSYSELSTHSYSNRISVFDSKSATEDLTTESELSFIPTEFIFFQKLLDYSLEISEKFNEEIRDKTYENDILKYFTDDTKINKIISSLNYKTDLQNVITQLQIDESETEQYKKLTKRKIKLQALNVKEKNKDYENIILEINKIKENLSSLKSKFNSNVLTTINELIDRTISLKELSKAEGIKQFLEYEILEIGSEEWKEFILTAQRYKEKINKEIDYCLFCLQEINEVTVIDKYYKYLQSSVEKDLSAVNNNVDRTIKEFNSLSTNLIIEKSKIDDWLKKNKIDLHQKILKVEEIYKAINLKVLDALRDSKKLENLKEDIEENIINELESGLDGLVDSIKEKQKELKYEKIDEEIKTIESFENEYHDKQKIETLDLIPEIEKFVADLSWIEKANKHRISTVGITRFQNKLFSKYVTLDYVNRFEEESKKLNALFSAEIEHRGQAGTTLLKLSVKGNKPIKILSEGEQRVIALANFLAETGLHAENIGIIFDDPVSSLDHSRREDIAHRLVEEAKNKQVVIFTHDIVFLLTLQKISNEQDVECDVTKISKINKTTGIVEDNLPWISMTVKARIGYLKNELQKLEKIEREITEEAPHKQGEYEDGAKLWCENLRETWERSIEEILLNNAIQRYSPAIETQRLKKAPFTNELYQEIEKGMSDCSQWVHDRAANLGEFIPDTEKLKLYVDSCEAFIKKNRA